MPFAVSNMFESSLVSIATVLAKGKTQISTDYPSTDSPFWRFQKVLRESRVETKRSPPVGSEESNRSIISIIMIITIL